MADMLELPWVGKDKSIIVEPWLLIKNTKLSYSGREHREEIYNNILS